MSDVPSISGTTVVTLVSGVSSVTDVSDVSKVTCMSRVTDLTDATVVAGAALPRAGQPAWLAASGRCLPGEHGEHGRHGSLGRHAGVANCYRDESYDQYEPTLIRHTLRGDASGCHAVAGVVSTTPHAGASNFCTAWLTPGKPPAVSRSLPATPASREEPGVGPNGCQR